MNSSLNNWRTPPAKRKANPYWGELAIIAVIFLTVGALFGAAF